MKQNVSAISIFSYPKINLALDILKKDPSDYHEIQTVYHQLEAPVDEIILEDDESGAVAVFCDHPKVPTDRTNTALKAALLLKEHLGVSKGVKITIHKKIPVMSGLGGGASNAVTVLKGLAKLWGIKCCHPELVEGCGAGGIHGNNCILRRIADQIGMDCSFFFAGGTALGEHFGEKITPFPSLPPEIKFEIIETGVEISSRDAYSWIDMNRCGKNKEKTARLIEAIRKQDAKGILANIHNDFEEFVFKKFPKIFNIKRSRFGGCMLCGSGGALLGW